MQPLGYMRFTSFIVTALIVVTAGCVGDVVDGSMMGDDEGSGSNMGGGEAEQMYKTTVHTIMNAKCGQSTCH